MPFVLTAPELAAYDAMRAKTSSAAHQSSGTGGSVKWSIMCVVGSSANQGPKVIHITECLTNGGNFETPWWFKKTAGTNMLSSKDSEVKVCAALDEDYKQAGAGDMLVSYSSDGPCPSCKEVFKATKKYYNIPTTVMYIKQKYTCGAKGIHPNKLYGYSDDQEVDGKGFFAKRL